MKNRIRELESKIKYKGFEYVIVDKGPLKYIYAQKSGDVIVAYEVFEIKRVKPNPMYSNYQEYDFVEKFPRDEDFGKWAWSFKTLDEARKVFEDF